MRWPIERAKEWYEQQPWTCGFNYVPSTAVNSTEMWQAESFDLKTIARELAWARETGLNSCRVFVQYLVWEADPEGLLTRFSQFLDAAGSCGISVLPVLFDDCAFSGKQPYLGVQDHPVPGVHNSGWTPSPGHRRVEDRSFWPRLRAYVSAMLCGFRDDRRVLAWDLYNEPGNANMGNKSLPLLCEVFEWARGVAPSQPLTAGAWKASLQDVTSLNLSDIVTFHCYGDLAAVREVVASLRTTCAGRPIMCTEWMARTLGSRFETHLPFFQRNHIGSYFWGLVAGRTQTTLPWASTAGNGEPGLWFHDLFYPDGKPYRQHEVEAIRTCVSGGAFPADGAIA